MTRLVPSFLCGLAAASVLLAGTAVRAQNQAGAARQPKTSVRVLHSEMPALPGYYMLRMKHVQKELELSPEQIDKLKALGKKYYEDMRADQSVWKDWRTMTPEQRTAKSAELRDKYKQRAEELRKNVEEVLLPKQLKALREINFRAAGPSALVQPSTLDKLHATDQQRAELEKIRQDMLDKYQDLQKKSFEKSLKVLTPEQREQLKKLLQTRGY